MSVPVSPLYSVMSRPKPKRSTKSQEVPHSAHQSEKSKHYHARVIGGQRAVDEMNPTDTPPNSMTVSAYPGL